MDIHAATLQSHLDFYLPPCGICNPSTFSFPPELLKIFYIARVLFSETSRHRIKTQAAPLLERQQIFSTSSSDSASTKDDLRQSPMDNFINLAKINSTGDIAHLLPREHVIYTENMFYKKLANRDLIKIDYEAQTGTVTSVKDFLSNKTADLLRSQKVYLLFDNSTSMNGERFKKLIVSKAIAIEYLRRVSSEKPEIYFRPFHSSVGDLVKATSREGIHALIKSIVSMGTGGGRITDIGAAVQQAIEDITIDPELREAEILVLTDGFGPIPRDLTAKLGSIKLHVILIPDLDIEKILKLSLIHI